MLEDLKEKAGELRSKEVELKERELAVVRRQVYFHKHLKNALKIPRPIFNFKSNIATILECEKCKRCKDCNQLIIIEVIFGFEKYLYFSQMVIKLVLIKIF